MARIAGVDIPNNKQGQIALTYIYGIGRSSAKTILEKAGVDAEKKVQDWTDDEQNSIRNIIADEYKVEGELRSEVTNQYQTFDGYWMLQRNTSSSRITSSWTKYKK